MEHIERNSIKKMQLAKKIIIKKNPKTELKKMTNLQDLLKNQKFPLNQNNIVLTKKKPK